MFLGKISFLEFMETMEKSGSSQEDKTIEDAEAKAESDTQMEVDETAKTEPVKPASMSDVLPVVFLDC